jgi:transposase-like protein
MTGNTKLIRRVHPTSFKVNVALEVIKGVETISQICSRYGVHPTQAHTWKVKALEALKTGFEEAKSPDRIKDELIEDLYKTVGKLQVELEWLKKKTGNSNY